MAMTWEARLQRLAHKCGVTPEALCAILRICPQFVRSLNLWDSSGIEPSQAIRGLIVALEERHGIHDHYTPPHRAAD